MRTQQPVVDLLEKAVYSCLRWSRLCAQSAGGSCAAYTLCHIFPYKYFVFAEG